MASRAQFEECQLELFEKLQDCGDQHKPAVKVLVSLMVKNLIVFSESIINLLNAMQRDPNDRNLLSNKMDDSLRRMNEIIMQER